MFKINDGEDIEPICHYESCGKTSNPEDFLLCRLCERTYHAKCCIPPLIKDVADRYPWQCSECKLCFVCHQKTNENRMIICDICDRAFHIDCLSPPLNDIPQGDWYCYDCQHCKSCKGSLTKERGFPNVEKNLWNKEFLLCSQCMEAFKNDLYCPVCYGVVDDEDEGNYICCDNCNLWIHAECDGIPTKKLKILNSAKYLCPICRSKA